METSVYPNFLPLSVVSNYIQNWQCDLQYKSSSSSTSSSSSNNNNNPYNLYYKCLQGYGQLTLQNSCTYKGQLKNGLYQGKGIFTWANKFIYQGQFRCGKICGKGKFIWPNGNHYQGEVYNGQRHGQGIFYCQSQNYVYVGVWKYGLKEGKGKIQYKDQSVYQGMFSNNKRNGNGKMIYASKNQYQGQWKNDKKQGKGTMNWINAHEKYVGDWKDDQPDGYGEYYWLQNKTQYKIFKNTYKGYWKKGQRQGFGAFFYSNGCRFQGYFVENMKHGAGITIQQNGNAKMQFYQRNRPLSQTISALPFSTGVPASTITSLHQKPQNHTVRLHQQSKKHTLTLPKLKPEPTLTQTSQQPSHINRQSSQSTHTTQTHTQQTNTITDAPFAQNQYKKYIDFQNKQLCQNFYNMLLRYNSRLRILYKNISTSNQYLKDSYSGMVLENYWKILKDCRIVNQNLSLVAINRQFSMGKKYHFQINLPDESVMEIYRREKYWEKDVQYQDVLWHHYYQNIGNSVLDWSTMKLSMSQNNDQKETKTLSKPACTPVDIHNPSNIILFRHFVCLIIHTSLLVDQSSKPLKQKVQSLITNLEHSNDINLKNQKNQKCQDNFTQTANAKVISVPEWVKLLHEQLIYELQQKECGLDGKIDVSLPVRKLYSLLQISNMFKDQTEKFLYLERIERYLNIKNSPLKKQYRTLYPDLQKTIKTNPQFYYLMNYEMTTKQINEFLFLCINRKIVASNQEQFQTKYKQVLANLRDNIKKVIKQPPTLQKQKLKCIYTETEKDKQKKQMILNMELAKIRKIQEENNKKIKQREQIQRHLMEWEDHDAEDIVIDGDQSQDYYG